MNVVIAAGGTGGHLYPAVALAEEFARQDPLTTVTFVGTGRQLENAILGKGTFPLEKIQVQGVVGRGAWASFLALALVPRAIWQAIRMLKSRYADLVIGTGGYTSPPVVIAACFLGIRRALLEPNAVPGMANRMLGPLAHRIFLSFEAASGYFNSSKSQIVGAPIRKGFFEADPMPTSGQVRTLLVCGGSQGARAINTAMTEALMESRLIREGLTIIHQTGAEDYDRVKRAYGAVDVQAEVVPFIEDMPRVLRSADLVISRCGALTLAELAACGKPAILIPFPYATHQHQDMNAKAVEKAGAAVVVVQSELSGIRLAREVETLVNNPERVKAMGNSSVGLRKTDSAEIMVRECRRLVKEQ